MRKIDVEAKPEIDLQRKINVEMTLQEALILTASVGVSNDENRRNLLRRKYDDSLDSSEVIPIRDDTSDECTLKLYRDLLTILANEGVKEDE